MGYTPSQVGSMFFIVPDIMTFDSLLGGWIYDRYHFRYSSALGMIIVATYLLFMRCGMGRDDLSSIYLSFVIIGLGSMLFRNPINTVILNALPAEMLGTASSLSSAVRSMGMSLRVSISTLLLSLQLNHMGYHSPAIDAKP